MFHVEMRKFPHNACLFNLSQDELRGLVIPWCQEKWIEVGERKWNPNETRMTVLEGPHLDVEDLRIGRGWRTAERESQDVTERVMAQVRAYLERESAPASPPAAAPADAQGLAPLLGADPAALLRAWQLTAQRRPELSPSQSLALAESTLSALDADSA